MAIKWDEAGGYLCAPPPPWSGSATVAWWFQRIIFAANEAKFSQYREKVMPILEQHGGRFLARSGNMKVVEGEWP